MKKVSILTLILITIITLTSCKKLDVVGNYSIKSFDKLLTTIDDGITSDEIINGWSLEAPDGSVRFTWSKDFSQSSQYDLILELNAEPFINAGLDVTKLPDTIVYSKDKILLGTKLGSYELKYNGSPTPLTSYNHIVDNYRKSIGYHADLDHFNIDLGNGNMFEWAKDMATNTVDNSSQDKDIVFVLNPEPFITAGVDADSVEGWTFTKVTVHMNGKATQVDKFLKPFNLQ